MIVYHVTPTVNVADILKEGLRLDKSESELWPRIWFCSACRVPRMMAHVSAWRNVPPGGLSVIVANVSRLDLNRQGTGNYWTAGPIAAHSLGLAKDILATIAIGVKNSNAKSK